MGAIVATPSGRLEGAEGRNVQVFRGIPYARPPIEGLRLRAPVPVEPWGDVRDATQFGKAAPQVGRANRLIRSFIGVADVAQSQDCLYLNVWTPAVDAGRRPVMVWFHGGAFMMGSGSTVLYDGSQLASEGNAVVVTCNYRLGALGYLNWRGLASGTGDELPETNLGLRDQIAVLEWVRDHIHCFGGDPEKVTIFGESAGGMSVGTLLGTPSACGLFHRAILQSGAAHNVASREQAAATARQFFDTLDIESPSREALERLPVSELMGAQLRTTTELGLVEGILPFQPSIDDDLLPEHPLEAIRKGMSRDVPVLIGTNRDEWKLFLVGDPRAIGIGEEQLTRRFERVFARLGDRGSELAKRAFKTYYRVWGPRGGQGGERWAAFQSDRLFHYPASRLADLHCMHSDKTWAYLFEWSPPIIGARLGACHGLELPFVFGTLRAPLLRPLGLFSRSAGQLSGRMQRAWVEFARTGCPAHEDFPEWPSYSLERRSTLAFGVEYTLRDDPHERARGFWGEVIANGKLPWAPAEIANGAAA
ncbi:MAG: carboxylesterase/lipase family protein [Myxococcota bacterium]